MADHMMTACFAVSASLFPGMLSTLAQLHCFHLFHLQTTRAGKRSSHAEDVTIWKQGLTMLSEKAARVLRHAGWTGQPRVDVAPLREKLEHRGFRVFPAAERFLAEFGLLEFFYITGQEANFDPLVVLPRLNAADVRGEWARIVGEDLCPIGEASNAYLEMLVGESGRVYGIYQPDLMLFGDDACEAIERLFNDERPLQQFLVPD